MLISSNMGNISFQIVTFWTKDIEEVAPILLFTSVSLKWKCVILWITQIISQIITIIHHLYDYVETQKWREDFKWPLRMHFACTRRNTWCYNLLQNFKMIFSPLLTTLMCLTLRSMILNAFVFSPAEELSDSLDSSLMKSAIESSESSALSSVLNFIHAGRAHELDQWGCRCQYLIRCCPRWFLEAD